MESFGFGSGEDEGDSPGWVFGEFVEPFECFTSVGWVALDQVVCGPVGVESVVADGEVVLGCGPGSMDW
jgi:hypothetical protein